MGRRELGWRGGWRRGFRQAQDDRKDVSSGDAGAVCTNWPESQERDRG